MRGVCLLLFALACQTAHGQHSFLLEGADNEPVLTFALPLACEHCHEFDCKGECQKPVVKEEAKAATTPTYRLETRRRYVRTGLRGGYWQSYTVRVPVTRVVCEGGVCRVVQ